VDECARLATAQHGLVAHRQARAAGLSDAAIRHRVARGTWLRVRTGLYLVAGTPASWDQAVFAAVLSAPDQGWASHATAARLWEFPGFAPEPIEITVPLPSRPRIRDVRVHRSGTIVDADVRVVGSVPTLSPARTVADLSSRLDEEALGAMVDDGLRRRVLTLGALHALMGRLSTIAPGRSPAKLRRVLAARSAGYHPGGSELEARVWRAIVAAGLPAPVRQHRVVVEGRTYFLDLAYSHRKIAIEIDGYDFHRGRSAFDRDRVRQNDLVRTGWTVLRFTSRSTDDEIVTAVRELLFGR
jgi:very-short-patch-repair endonuclease